MLGSVNSVLGWDERTQMPEKGAEHRAAQSSLLARMVHERFTSPRIDELLRAGRGIAARGKCGIGCGGKRAGDPPQLRPGRKLPASLVEEAGARGRAGPAGMGRGEGKIRLCFVRTVARKDAELKREEAKCIGYTRDMYDALLDEFEPGETTANLRQTFETLRGPLVELIGKVAASGKKAPLEILERNYSPEAQATLARGRAVAVGFDFSAGRLDVSLHPFCTGLGPGDTRMTTRYDPRYLGTHSSACSTRPATGSTIKAFPPRILARRWARRFRLAFTSRNRGCGKTSLAAGRDFWKHFLPKARAVFPEALKEVSEDQWYFAINDIRPSFIRTESDEATYNLHILLRFELEQALLNDELKMQGSAGRMECENEAVSWDRSAR